MTENGAAFRTYTYDNGGNIITDVPPGAETFAYFYNNRNRMASVTRNGVAYATYIYNALEQLVSRNTSASGGPVGSVHYIYDLDGHLIAEADAATGATTREYLWLPSNDNGNDSMAEEMGIAANDNGAVDLPLAVIEGANLYHFHSDHLGRPVRMTDAAKATVWQVTYKPFGEVQSITGTLAQNLRFPGQYFQIETMLAHNWHRHYDPVTGRYTQPDPLRFVDGPAIYQYAMASPFMKTDRLGLHFTLDGSPDGTRIPLPYPYGPFIEPFLHNHPTKPQMCMGPSEEQALQACLAAAAGTKTNWRLFCNASMWTPPIDHTRQSRCMNEMHSSKIAKANWCYGEYGD